MFFEGFSFLNVTKLRESVRNRSQMVSGCVRDVCDALARVSALAELQKPPKFTEIGEPGSKSLTMCLSWAVGDKLLILEIFHDFFEILNIFCL